MNGPISGTTVWQNLATEGPMAETTLETALHTALKPEVIAEKSPMIVSLKR